MILRIPGLPCVFACCKQSETGKSGNEVDQHKYNIALNFQGSRFSRIAIFEDFVEIIFVNLLHVHTAHRVSKNF